MPHPPPFRPNYRSHDNLVALRKEGDGAIKDAGLHPKQLERYLGDSEFLRVFQMSKADFYRLPKFKQQMLKDERGLGKDS